MTYVRDPEPEPEKKIENPAPVNAHRVSNIVNDPQILDAYDHALLETLVDHKPYAHFADSGSPVYVADISSNFKRLELELDSLIEDDLWPCIITHIDPRNSFSAPLDVSATLAASLVAHLRRSSTRQLPFPSVRADVIQYAVARENRAEAHLQPYFFGDQSLIGLPAKRAALGFVRGAKFDAILRRPFSPPTPLDEAEDPPRARIAVETRKPNLTVVYTNGYFASSLMQLGPSTPASGNVAFGLYRFGIEWENAHIFQDSIVSVPDQLRIYLDLAPKD